MAKKHRPDHAPQKKTIFCFTTSCFKFSDHIKSPQGKEKAETITGKKNHRRWLCWSRRLKFKKPAAAKTVVPVDGSPAAASSAKSKKFKPGYKGRSRDAETPPCHQDHTTAEESPYGGGRIQETPTEAVSDQSLAVETHLDPTEPATCPPTGRKLNAVRYPNASSSSQPGSPDQIRRRVPGVRSAVMSPSSSSTLGPIIKNPFSKTAAGKKLEPVVAMSVIMVTLLIMIMWGRLCAILSTSAWLYFIPKFRSRERGSGGLDSDSRVDMESEEYKKKVVLEGLLDRNRRS